MGETKKKTDFLCRRKLYVNLIFWPIVCVLILFALGLDLRFGPDFRLSSKIINPDNPDFDPSAFSFDDYNDYGDLVYVIQKMFPRGTDQETIMNFFEAQGTENRRIEIRDLPLDYIPDKDKEDTSDTVINVTNLYKHNCFINKGKPSNSASFFLKFDENDKLLRIYLKSCGSIVGE